MKPLVDPFVGLCDDGLLVFKVNEVSSVLYLQVAEYVVGGKYLVLEVDGHNVELRNHLYPDA